MVDREKEHYDKYDFIQQHENVYVHITKGNSISHSHDFYELVVITSGRGTHIINDIAYNVVEGDIFLLLPSDVHSYRAFDEYNQFSWLSCIWLPEFYDIQDEKLRETKKFTDEYTYDIYSQLVDMNNEFHAKKPQYLKIMRLILEVVLEKMIRMIGIEKEDYSIRRKRKLVKEAISYIHAHYNQDIELKDVADHLMISQVYLSKLFKIQMQTSVMQYQKKLRIDRAMQLIGTTDMKIEEISKDVGFKDIKSLYSLFKNRTGMSPGAYRKHFIENASL